MFLAALFLGTTSGCVDCTASDFVFRSAPGPCLTTNDGGLSIPYFQDILVSHSVANDPSPDEANVRGTGPEVANETACLAACVARHGKLAAVSFLQDKECLCWGGCPCYEGVPGQDWRVALPADCGDAGTCLGDPSDSDDPSRPLGTWSMCKTDAAVDADADNTEAVVGFYECSDRSDCGEGTGHCCTGGTEVYEWAVDTQFVATNVSAGGEAGSGASLPQCFGVGEAGSGDSYPPLVLKDCPDSEAIEYSNGLLCFSSGTCVTVAAGARRLGA